MKVEKREANVFGFLLLTLRHGVQVLVKKDDISTIRPVAIRDPDSDEIVSVIRIVTKSREELVVDESIDEIFYQMKECNFFEGD